MTRLEQLTRERFGDDAQRLLDAHAIVPLVNRARPKAAIKGWKEGFDPSIEIGFHSLGLLVGERSGITVWDIDSLDLRPPVDPNVKTSKGCHIYTAHNGEDRLIKPVDGVDVLGKNGYAIFYGPDKEFLHPRLAPVETINDWMTLLPSISSPKGIHEGYDEGYKEGYEEGYYNWLLSEGYELDLEAIERGYVALMRNRPEGTRNNSLFIYARELLRCGIDTSALVASAIEAGLDPDEASDTVSNADADIAMMLSPSVHERVTMWRDTTFHMVPEYAQPVIECLATRAIVTNDLSPFIVQDDIVRSLREQGIERTQQAVSKTLVALDKNFGVIKIIFLGYLSNGHRKPNAYRLCIDGQPVSELTRKQPLAGAQSPDKPDSTLKGGE